jgi:hypothetical protein
MRRKFYFPLVFVACIALASCTHSTQPATAPLGYTYHAVTYDSLGNKTNDGSAFIPIISEGNIAGIPNARLVKWILDTVAVADLPNGDVMFYERPPVVYFGNIPDRNWITYPLNTAIMDQPTVIFSKDTTYPDGSFLGLQDTIIVRRYELDSINPALKSVKYDQSIIDTNGALVNGVPFAFGDKYAATIWYSSVAGFYSRYNLSSPHSRVEMTLTSYVK